MHYYILDYGGKNVILLWPFKNPILVPLIISSEANWPLHELCLLLISVLLLSLFKAFSPACFSRDLRGSKLTTCF